MPYYPPSGGGGGGSVSKYATTIGDGSTLVYTVTHSLNTSDISVAVWELTTPFELVFPTVAIATVNSITVTFSSAPASNSMRVVVFG